MADDGAFGLRAVRHLSLRAGQSCPDVQEFA